MDTKNIGLRNIEVADTKISYIDGQKGKLIYRGYDILDLTKNSNFEETCFLLLHDELPTKNEYYDFKTELVDARVIPKQMQINMGNWRKDADPMDVLQAFVAAFWGYYDEEFSTKEASYSRAINLIAKVPTIVSSWHRIRNGKKIIEPNSDLSHAANFLFMLNDEKPDPELEKIFDICLILHADHTLNASTFAAREVASTRAHMYSAASAAVGALSGELHGGANYEVMRMLLDIKTEEKNFPFNDFKNLGYKSHVFGQKSYNGVAFLSKINIDKISLQLIKDKNNQSRIIVGDIKNKSKVIKLVNIYVPNGNPIGTEKYEYKKN